MSLSFVVGAAVSILMPSTGCLIPDKCILLIQPGIDWCTTLSGAVMWPVGEPENAEPVEQAQGGPPVGCSCFNNDEAQVLTDKVPAVYFAELAGEIELAARLKCDSLVPEGFDHNCFSMEPGEIVFSPLFVDGPGSCVGDCVYTDYCGDPTPHECEAMIEGPGGDDDAGETGDMGDTGTSDTGTDGTGTDGTGGIWNAGQYISCAGSDCEIDRAFAVAIWDDPSVLIDEQTRLVFDSVNSRFVFQGVSPGSLASELGLIEGDVLESVNGQVISDVDTALEVYSDSGDASVLRVRVERRGQWEDFTYTFVN